MTEHDDTGGAEDGPEPGSGPEHERRQDDQLRRHGAELRGAAPPTQGTDVIHAELAHRADRARRANWILATAAAVLVVALVGVVVVRDDTPGAELAAGDGAALGDAAAIVDALPDEPVDPRDVELVASVRRFDTCDALLDDLHRVGAAHIGSRGFGEQYGIGVPGYAGTLNSEARSGSFDGQDGIALTDSVSGTGETLGTNVIVAGVDEPDTVKATGTLVVELVGQQLRIVDTAGAAVLSTLQLGSGPPGAGPSVPGDDAGSSAPVSLLVDGDRVVVFGSEITFGAAIPGDPSASRPPIEHLTITFVDISDPAAPSISDRVRIQGARVAARRVGDQVRLVTSSSLADLPLVAPSTPNGVQPALTQNRLAVASSSVDDWIPTWDRGAGEPEQRLMGCDRVEVPDTFAGVQMTSMVQFAMDGPFEPTATGLLAPSEDLTADATDVVIASHVWVDPIDRTEDFDDWSTALHRFTFDQDGPRYVASGKVRGSVRDDFSLSVLDESTVGAVTVDVLPWQRRDEADVTVRVLSGAEGSTAMEESGSVVPPSSDGSLSGVRFLGDRLLLSSGLGGIALSVVDLSDRAAPAVVGDVALPGGGSYFHPMGDERVLVLGTTYRLVGEQLRTGLHATIVDLRAGPVVLGSWRRDDASSSALYDHHAFTWWPNRSLAGFGIDDQSYSNAQPPPLAVLLSVQGDQIAPTVVQPGEADLGPRCRLDQPDRSACDATGPPQVQRMLVVDGAPWLYTSESLQRLDPQTLAAGQIVPLRPRYS